MTQQDRIKAAERRLNESGSAENQRLIEISEALADDRRVLRLQARMKAAAPGSVMWMEAKYILNRLYLEGMTEEERESTAEGRALMAETGELYRAVRDARKAMREAEPEDEGNEEERPAEPESPWKLTWQKALQAIFVGVATWILLRMLCG